MGNKLGSNGLVALWNRIFNLIKLITGDVQVSTKGDLQTQINNIKTFTKSGSSAAGGLVPTPPTTEGTTKYICEDGTWKNIDEHTASFTSVDSKTSDKWTDIDALKSGEKHSSIFNKVSIMFKNIRFLYGLLGTTDISDLGDGTITNALSTLNSNLSNYEINKMYTSFEHSGLISYNLVDVFDFMNNQTLAFLDYNAFVANNSDLCVKIQADFNDYSSYGHLFIYKIANYGISMLIITNNGAYIGFGSKSTADIFKLIKLN